jgi:DNA-directed RNA polymerase specialized sigma24 family protein
MDRLFVVTYDDLCLIARRNDHARGASDLADGPALVNETYLQLRRRRSPLLSRPSDLRQFLVLMARMMNTVARDRRRRRTALKRGGARPRVCVFDDDRVRSPGRAAVAEPDVVELHEALALLEAHDAAWLEVVVQHDLLGRTIGETAARMGLTQSVVKAHRRRALAWLRRAMSAPRQRTAGARGRPIPHHRPARRILRRRRG